MMKHENFPFDAFAGTPAESGAEEDVRQQIDGVMAQCLYLLYGVDITHRDESWGSGAQVSPSSESRLPPSCTAMAFIHRSSLQWPSYTATAFIHSNGLHTQQRP